MEVLLLSFDEKNFWNLVAISLFSFPFHTQTNKQVLVILEYMQKGDLHSFLQKLHPK